MKRFTVIKEILSVLDDEDIAIFSSSEMNKEAFLCDRAGNFYITEKDLAISLALGVAISTTKKVFVFCDDYSFIRELNSMMQISASKCRNIFCIIFNSGVYQEEGMQPSLFSSVYSPKGVIFNMGIIVHDLTKIFQNKSSLKELHNIFKGLKGPLSIVVDVDKGLKKDLNEVSISETDLRKRIYSFIVE